MSEFPRPSGTPADRDAVEAGPDAERRRLLGLLAKGGYAAPIALTMLHATPARASSVGTTPTPPSPGPGRGRGRGHGPGGRWGYRPRRRRPWWWWWS